MRDLWSFWLDRPTEVELQTGRGRIGTSRLGDHGNVVMWSGQSTAVLRGQVARLDMVELADSLIAAPRDAFDPPMIGVLCRRDAVRVSAAGTAIPLEVEFSAPADPSGRRWFAAYLRGPDAGIPDLVVTALDAAGQVIDQRAPEPR